MDSCQQASCAGPRAVRGGGCGSGCSRAPRVARSPRHARPGLRRLLPRPASLPSPVRARHRAAPRVPRHGHRAPRHRRVGRWAGDVAGDVVVVCQHRPGARDGGGGARRACARPASLRRGTHLLQLAAPAVRLVVDFAHFLRMLAHSVVDSWRPRQILRISDLPSNSRHFNDAQPRFIRDITFSCLIAVF
jgi:hypothetical protein